MFWRVLKDASCGEFLVLSENIRFLGKEHGPSTVFIRKCYLDLQVIVFKRNKIRITGNPGIGKTYFGYYLLYLLALQNQTIVYDNATEAKPIVFDGENATKSDDIEPYLIDPNVWYIVDGKNPSNVNAKTILICSPNKSHYKHFDKYSGSTSRFMPTWKWREINTCRKLYTNIKKKQALYLFNRWGGIPRFILEKANDITHQNRLEQAISCVKVVIFDYVSESLVETDEISHMIAHIYVNLPINYDDDDDNEGDYDLEDDNIMKTEEILEKLSSHKLQLDQDGKEPYTQVTVRFASDYLKQRVTDQYEARIREKIVAQIRAGIGSSLLGSCFEYIAHRILRKGGHFDVRPLDPYRNRNYKDSNAVVNLSLQNEILKFNKNSIDSIES